jgi:hypothetical protein
MPRFFLPTMLRAPDGATAAPTPAPAAAPDAPDGSLFDALGDAPEPAAGAAAAADPAKPEGGPAAAKPDWLPEQFWRDGKIDHEALAKSWKDMRTTVARGEHKPPENPDAYTVPAVEGLPEGFIGGEKDTLWPQLRLAAHAAGVTQRQLDALAKPFLAAAAEAAKTAQPLSPEAVKAARDAEIEKLGPNARAVIRDVAGWLRGMEARGVLTKPELQALWGVSSAEGVRALAKLREAAGEQPIPIDAFASGDMSQADAQRLMREGFAKGDQAMIDKARRRLAEMDGRGELVLR